MAQARTYEGIKEINQLTITAVSAVGWTLSVQYTPGPPRHGWPTKRLWIANKITYPKNGEKSSVKTTLIIVGLKKVICLTPSRIAGKACARVSELCSAYRRKAVAFSSPSASAFGQPCLCYDVLLVLLPYVRFLF
jgi:hypothetical protein